MQAQVVPRNSWPNSGTEAACAVGITQTDNQPDFYDFLGEFDADPKFSETADGQNGILAGGNNNREYACLDCLWRFKFL